MNAFESFLDAWLVRQEHYLDELMSAQQHCNEMSDGDLKDLITKIMSHYEQYYAEKSKVARMDVYLVLSPTWFTTLERTLLWIGGFKPGLVLSLVKNLIHDLSEEQKGKIRRFVEDTRAGERALDEEMARIQESIAAPPILEAARRARRLVDGEMKEEELVLNTLKSVLEAVLASADSLRTKTVMKTVEILSPAQNVRFLAAAVQFHMSIRERGLQRDAKRSDQPLIF